MSSMYTTTHTPRKSARCCEPLHGNALQPPFPCVSLSPLALTAVARVFAYKLGARKRRGPLYAVRSP